MIELIAETILPSPDSNKRLSDSVVNRKSKRKRKNSENISLALNETNASIYITCDTETETKQNLDLSEIYWEDDNDMELEFIPDDIFAEEKLLEKANLENINHINNSEKFITDSFETITQFSQKFDLKNANDGKQVLEVLAPETQFNISETLFENLCNENLKSEKPTIQVKHEIYDAGAGCSKFLSPVKCAPSKIQKILPETILPVPGSETQFGVSESQFSLFCKEIEDKEHCDKNNDSRKIETSIKTSISNCCSNKTSSLVQSICDDFSELEDPIIISQLIKSKPIYDLTPKFQFRNKAIRTYSNRRRKNLHSQRRPATATVIVVEKIYDSDSSQSSGLSIQKDEINLNVQIKPEQINIETSQQVCENLLNLSTFFSDSFVYETDNKNIKKCKEIDRKWMLEYYRNKTNFQFSTSVNSDEEFYGCADSDDENEDKCLCEDQNLDKKEEDVDILSELDDHCKGFTQALLNSSFIERENNIDQQNLFDSISKKECSEQNENSSAGFEQKVFTKPSTVHKIGLSNQLLRNTNQNSCSDIQFREDKVNYDILNSELWLDEDLLSEIKTQNYTKTVVNNNNKLELKENETLKCQIPLNSVFNGKHLTTNIAILKDKFSITSKSDDNQNQIFEGFKFASKKPVIISENALKQAKKLITEVLTEDITNLEEENKENNLIPKKVKFKTASDKSIKINDDAREFLNGIDVESFTNDFDFETEMTRNSPKQNQMCIDKDINKSSVPKDRLLEANNFLNGISAEITNVQTPQFVSFKSGLGKPINISEKSLVNAEKFINESNKVINEELVKADDSFKVPIFEGFRSGKGKPIKISEKALQKAAKMIEEINNEIDSEKFNMNISEENKVENTFINKQENIHINSSQKNEIEKKTLENENFNLISETQIQRVKKNEKRPKKYSVTDKIYPRRITRSSSRICSSTSHSTIESPKVEQRKSLPNNFTAQTNNPIQVLKDNNNLIVENLCSPELSKTTNFISQKTEISTNSSNRLNTIISTPLSHKTITPRSQFSTLTPLGTRKNILSLSRRNFKPPAPITPSFNGNLENCARSSNHLQTPNLKEFFNSLSGIETSTPITSSTPLTLTKEITPSSVLLMENEMKNSFINNDENMEIINCTQQGTNNLKEITLSGNLSQNLTNKTITPSPKMRIGRLKMWNKPPALLPLAYIDTCKPSGLTRKNNFLSKLENENDANLELRKLMK